MDRVKNDTAPEPTTEIDRRLNCAAEICCPPPAARQARAAILVDLGCPEHLAMEMSTAMAERGIVFMPVQLAQVIAEMVDHPGRDGEGEGVAAPVWPDTPSEE